MKVPPLRFGGEVVSWPVVVAGRNRLTKLSGDRDGQHSIRVNDQWRICFRWEPGDAFEVEITDYH